MKKKREKYKHNYGEQKNTDTAKKWEIIKEKVKSENKKWKRASENVKNWRLREDFRKKKPKTMKGIINQKKKERSQGLKEVEM